MMNQLVKSDNRDLSILLHQTGGLTHPFAQEIKLLDCHIAGTTHRNLTAVEPRLQPGAIFKLRREPANKHDALAIAVDTADNQNLGFIPREKNEVLARLLDAGKLLEARLTAKEWKPGYSDKNWLRLDIAVYLRDL